MGGLHLLDTDRDFLVRFLSVTAKISEVKLAAKRNVGYKAHSVNVSDVRVTRLIPAKPRSWADIGEFGTEEDRKQKSKTNKINRIPVLGHGLYCCTRAVKEIYMFGHTVYLVKKGVYVQIHYQLQLQK